MTDNILDKIIQAKENQKKAELDPQNLVSFLLRSEGTRLNSSHTDISRMPSSA